MDNNTPLQELKREIESIKRNAEKLGDLTYSTYKEQILMHVQLIENLMRHSLQAAGTVKGVDGEIVSMSDTTGIFARLGRISGTFPENSGEQNTLYEAMRELSLAYADIDRYKNQINEYASQSTPQAAEKVSEEEIEKCYLCGKENVELFECERCSEMYCDSCSSVYNAFTQIDYNCCKKCAERNEE